MSEFQVFVARRIPDNGLALLREACDVRVWEDELPPTADELRQAAANVDGLLTMLTDRVDGDLLDAASKLRVVSNYAVGYDNIDVPAATARGIPVGNTPGVLTEATADLTFALLMAAARRLSESEAYVNNGEWRTWHPTTLLGRDVSGATLGIVGLGRIGQAVARRAAGFGMRIVYHGGSDAEAAERLNAQAVSLDELLRESDYVSLHAPLTHETRGMIGMTQLKRMKPTGILINTARGGLVETDALVQALKDGQIAAAALDVTDPEPLPADHPLVGLANCLVVPHIGSATHTARERMAEIAARNLLAGLRGERLPHVVNPEVYAG